MSTPPHPPEIVVSIRPLSRATLAVTLLLGALPSWSSPPQAAPPPALTRGQWGAPAVSVTREGPAWTIAGTRRKVTLLPDLSLRVETGGTTWPLVPSSPADLRVRVDGRDVPLRLADAGRIDVVPYDTGYKTGVKLTLSGWDAPAAAAPGLTLYLTLALEGGDEELAFDAAAEEKGAAVRQLDWPPALDGRAVDYTVLNNFRGILLPRAWPEAYDPIRGDRNHPDDSSVVQSHVVECWSASWWGFQKGGAAMMVIVETPDDAAYSFRHPAGGPTAIGPRWRPQLGRLGYPRAGRMVFFDEGDYADLAKRYRRHAMETGLFVSLEEKIARSPKVRSLVGTPLSRVSILRNLSPDSSRYDREKPETNYRLTTFDERARELRALKAKGVERFHVVLTGWPYLGYDRQHPDGLPPPPPAGGWEGMKRLADAARELGYLFSLHDQYRDYYVDAPSYQPQFAIHEEDAASPPQAFPGTRFGTWKEGGIPFMRHWDGGKQTFINSRFMLGHLEKNYRLMFEHGIRPGGSYLDVFGYVPPDEDWNPEHPTTRTRAIEDRARCFTWARRNLGIVGTEAAVDWTVAHADISSPLGPGKAGIPVPLFNLVYHDAILTPYAPTGGEERMNRRDRPNWLYGMLNGGVPQVGLADFERRAEVVRRMAALHERVALLEMTDHEFLDGGFQRERTTFADGTTVTVDWEAGTVAVAP